MKTVKIQVEYDESKYQALERYAMKCNRSVESEINKTINELYKELVPKDVREYIEETDKKIAKKDKKKPPLKAKENKTTDNNNGGGTNDFPPNRSAG